MKIDYNSKHNLKLNPSLTYFKIHAFNLHQTLTYQTSLSVSEHTDYEGGLNNVTPIMITPTPVNWISKNLIL